MHFFPERTMMPRNHSPSRFSGKTRSSAGGGYRHRPFCFIVENVLMISLNTLTFSSLYTPQFR
jgi:hypothetical protein